MNLDFIKELLCLSHFNHIYPPKKITKRSVSAAKTNKSSGYRLSTHQMTRRKTSTKVRQLSDTCRYPIGTCSQTALLFLWQLLDKSSTALRLSFENDSKGCRRTVVEPSKECRSGYCSGNKRIRKMVERQSKQRGREWGKFQINSLYFSGLFSAFLAKMLSPVLSLPKPCLSPTLALRKKHRFIGPFFGFLISFYMILFCVCLAHARQSSSPEAAHGVASSTDSVNPLQIGDTIPNALWNLPLQVVNHPDGEDTITLNDYKGKLIILDFWATWCAPCIGSLYKLDTIQKDFKEDFVVIPITNENAQIADKFFKSRAWDFPTVVNDTTLKKFFPHKYIPHYIWINKQQKVSAITGHENIKRENIQAMSIGHEIKMPTKNDLLNFDPSLPLFIDGNGGNGSSIKYRSLFSAPISGLRQIASAVSGDTTKEQSRFYCINCQIQLLYTIAYHRAETFPEKRIILDVKDPSKIRWMGRNGEDYEEWANENAYCYELITKSGSSAGIREQIAEDLDRFFGLSARFEKRMMDCYVLTAISGLEKSFSKGGERAHNLSNETSAHKYIRNKTMDVLTGYLDDLLPLNVVDETNCLNNLDLQFPQPDGSNFKTLQDVLRRQGISLEKARREIEFFIISEN